MPQNKIKLFLCGLSLLLVASLIGGISPALYNSPFPHEHFDSESSSTAPTGGLTDPASALTKSVTLYESAFCFLNRNPSELYVTGGGADAQNYIARVDPVTLAQLKRTTLDCPDSECPYNQVWAPSTSISNNGFIYMVAESRVWKLDSDINVVGYYSLPIKDGVYNALKILGDGNIMVKGWGADGGVDDRSSITILTPDLAPVVAEYVLPDKSYGRVSLLTRNGVEQIYITGESNLRRFSYQPGQSPVLSQDTAWTYKYRDASDRQTSPGGIATFIGNYAYFTDNAKGPEPAGPISVYRVNVDNAADAQKFTPWPRNKGGYHFNKHIADYVNNVVVVADSSNARMAGVRYENGGFKILWDQRFDSKVVAVASGGSRYLYTTDLKTSSEYVVVLDIVTGQEIRRFKTGSKTSSIGGITFGYNKDVFYNGGNNSSLRIYNP